MSMEDQTMFRCGRCRHEQSVKEVLVIRGVTPYLKCPNCGFEETDDEYSLRNLKEGLSPD